MRVLSSIYFTTLVPNRESDENQPYWFQQAIQHSDLHQWSADDAQSPEEAEMDAGQAHLVITGTIAETPPEAQPLSELSDRQKERLQQMLRRLRVFESGQNGQPEQDGRERHAWYDHRD